MYCIDQTVDEPIMLINSHIGFDSEDGMGVDGAMFQKELLYLDTLGKKRIQVWINTVGGSMIDGYNIASAILKTKTPVDTYNVGLCASMGGVIFMCGRNRIMMDYSQFMMHPVQNASDDKLLKSFTDSASSLLSSKSDLSQEQVAELMNETTWLNAEQCLEKGFCTEIEKVANVNKKRMSTANVDNFLKEASLITNRLIQPTKTIKKMSMLKVTNRLGLVEDANEESILTAIQAIENKATTEKTALQSEIDALKNQLATKETELAKATEDLDGALVINCSNMVKGFATIGKIANDEAVINKFVELAKNDFEGTKDLLEKLPVNKVANKIDTVDPDGVQAPVNSLMYTRLKEVTNQHKN